MKNFFKLLFLILVIMLMPILAANAAEKNVTLEWDENADADSYVVYWSRTSGEFTDVANTLKIGKVTSATVTILDVQDGDYYFAVKAFNSCGNSSDFSDEVLLTYQSTPPEKPTGVKAFWEMLITFFKNLWGVNSGTSAQFT